MTITRFHSARMPLEDYFKTNKKIRVTIENEVKAVWVDFDFSDFPRKINIVDKWAGLKPNGKPYKWVEKAIDGADERLCKAFTESC